MFPITTFFFPSTATTYLLTSSISVTPLISILEIATERWGKSLNDVVASPCRRFENRALEKFCLFFCGEGFRYAAESVASPYLDMNNFMWHLHLV